jgi:hypothetical protein
MEIGRGGVKTPLTLAIQRDLAHTIKSQRAHFDGTRARCGTGMRLFGSIIFGMASATVAFGASSGLPLPYTDIVTNITFAASAWAPGSNNSPGPVGGGTDIDPIVGNTLGGDTTNSYWVNQALQYYNNINNSGSPAEVALLAQFSNQWAVISWGVNSSGTHQSCDIPLRSISPPGDENQTVLVQVDPPGEPQFNYSNVFTPEPALYRAFGCRLGRPSLLRRAKASFQNLN